MVFEEFNNINELNKTRTEKYYKIPLSKEICIKKLKRKRNLQFDASFRV